MAFVEATAGVLVLHLCTSYYIQLHLGQVLLGPARHVMRHQIKGVATARRSKSSLLRIASTGCLRQCAAGEVVACVVAEAQVDQLEAGEEMMKRAVDIV
jgi:hypothetical protein